MIDNKELIDELEIKRDDTEYTIKYIAIIAGIAIIIYIFVEYLK